jgi:hypothetical protein
MAASTMSNVSAAGNGTSIRRRWRLPKLPRRDCPQKPHATHVRVRADDHDGQRDQREGRDILRPALADHSGHQHHREEQEDGPGKGDAEGEEKGFHCGQDSRGRRGLPPPSDEMGKGWRESGDLESGASPARLPPLPNWRRHACGGQVNLRPRRLSASCRALALRVASGKLQPRPAPLADLCAGAMANRNPMPELVFVYGTLKEAFQLSRQQRRAVPVL